MYGTFVCYVLSKGIHTMRKRKVYERSWKVTVFRERRTVPWKCSSNGSRSIFPVRRKTNGWAGTYLLWIKHRFQARVQPRFVNSFGFQPARARTLVKEKKKKKRPSTLSRPLDFEPGDWREYKFLIGRLSGWCSRTDAITDAKKKKIKRDQKIWHFPLE